MYYAGGMELCYNVMEMFFGVTKNSGSYKTPKEFWEGEFAMISGKFDTIMSQAGVSN